MSSPAEDVLTLSTRKWQWMSAREVSALDGLVHEEAVFVHMGATFTKAQELEVIRSGQIHYRDVDVEDVSVRFVGTTAIVLSTLRLTAVVGGIDVTNPFVVTEVYVSEGDVWRLGSMAFTRLLTS